MKAPINFLLSTVLAISLLAFSSGASSANSTYLPLDIASGGLTTCSRMTDFTVYCWSKTNQFGQLGNGSTSTPSEPSKVVGLSNTVQIEVGIDFACALVIEGTVKCWGKNAQGALGDGTTVNRYSPIQVSDISRIIDIAIIDEVQPCALDIFGQIFCWGAGTTTPRLVEGFSGQWMNIVSTGKLCAIDVSSDLYCLDSPSKVLSGIEDAKGNSIWGACAKTLDNKLYCWGHNYFGTIGNPNAPRIYGLPPTFIIGGVRDFAVGAGNYCAAMIVGGVRCWGMNPFELGGAGLRVYEPTVLPNVAETWNVSAGKEHMCLLKFNLSVVCWGNSNAILSKWPTSQYTGLVAIKNLEPKTIPPPPRISLGNVSEDGTVHYGSINLRVNPPLDFRQHDIDRIEVTLLPDNKTCELTDWQFGTVCDFSPVINGETYLVYATSYNQYGSSSTPLSIPLIPKSNPDPVTKIRIRKIKSTSASVYFNEAKPNGGTISGYTYRLVKFGVTFRKGKEKPIYPGMTITKLKPGTKYAIFITARNEVGLSEAAKTFKTIRK